jgi:hypothetical protein
LIKIDDFLDTSVIILDQSKELNHFEILKLYYSDIRNRKISLNLVYLRLDHIWRKLVRKLINKMFIGFTLTGKESNYNRYDKCIFGQIKVKSFSVDEFIFVRNTKPFQILYINLLIGSEPVLDGKY